MLSANDQASRSQFSDGLLAGPCKKVRTKATLSQPALMHLLKNIRSPRIPICISSTVRQCSNGGQNLINALDGEVESCQHHMYHYPTYPELSQSTRLLSSVHCFKLVRNSISTALN